VVFGLFAKLSRDRVVLKSVPLKSAFFNGLLDLQFGGSDTIDEIVSTNITVNRSVGGQGQRRMKFPDATPINQFFGG